jgi:hypothetical protein
MLDIIAPGFRVVNTLQLFKALEGKRAGDWAGGEFHDGGVGRVFLLLWLWKLRCIAMGQGGY